MERSPQRWCRFHDETSSNLHDAIRMMGHHQLGISLSDEDINAIAVWMRSMTGEIDPAYIAAPELPPSVNAARAL
jgi:cytochrome c peroxidase